jgi:uncharacterized membrane protein YphA (DoxX/SURF4 family)
MSVVESAGHALPQRNKADGPLTWVALLLLCSAYIEGGLAKLLDFPAATAELAHFGLQPAGLLAAATILVELVAPALILSNRGRWLGAAILGAFTLGATFIANQFWTMQGHERFMATNAFFEHLGLVGAFALVAWSDRSAVTRARR